MERIRPEYSYTERVRFDGPPASLAIERGEQALDDLKSEFRASLQADLKRLSEALHAVEAGGPERDAHMAALFRLALNIRGQGGTFGYPLLTEIGERLCRYIEALPAVEADHLAVIALHVDAMTRVALDAVADDGGEAGRALLDGLDAARAKTLAADTPE